MPGRSARVVLDLVEDLGAGRALAVMEQDHQAMADRMATEWPGERAREAAQDMAVRAECTARAAGLAERAERAERALVDTEREEQKAPAVARDKAMWPREVVAALGEREIVAASALEAVDRRGFLVRR
jgi:hypothetical protein